MKREEEGERERKMGKWRRRRRNRRRIVERDGRHDIGDRWKQV